ncbi:type I restriction endonuclease subunit R [Prosthecobacter sp.]|uniref:type I restriction endonuclease subunit R n=1 Tax=Prosthecobacter sp. TaxID=1965333 RepID=UPI002AB8E2C9|nr:type I restriction endonuclease subunit R [Prosthecobacter sp.]MDZ4405858.1 type I restriction endonuclease subunit R [Prosthecobacter sp.]
MAYTDINSEDRLVQKTFADHLETVLGWDSVYAWNEETFGPAGTLGRMDTREVVLTRDLRAALVRLNPQLPPSAITEAVAALTRHDFTRSLLQHNQEFYKLIRDGVPVTYKDAQGQRQEMRARVIDFSNGLGTDGKPNNRFLVVRELKLTGLRTPGYNRRADLVCFVNGLPLVFVELKAVYKNIRTGFDGNLTDYMDEHVIAHAFHHNAFLIVSNGHRARYGSITSQWEHFAQWKRLDEDDRKGSVEAQRLLDGMLQPDRLLDLVANFILYDASKPGATRKVVARNHQVMGVNNAVESVRRQEILKKEYPVEKRLTYRTIQMPRLKVAEDPPEADGLYAQAAREQQEEERSLQLLDLVESAHPDLGKLGVFWHTQGSGKSYSMVFFVEKVRREISSKFTFLIMTDRNDLDGQIYRTFVGCGIGNDQTPRAATGDDLEALLKENHRYIFSLIHKFNQDVDPRKPYSSRDDIIVISDEAHRTQTGKMARNMRLALPNAAFIGFTGTPLFKHDHLTRRIFGGYVSKYDFKRSEEDGATVKLVYANRGEKLGIAKLDLNDRIAEAVARAELDPDKEALLEKLLGKDYEIITARDRLNKLALDFVEHCATRWESGKSMLVCIDKITAGRMSKRVRRLWKLKLARVRVLISQKEATLNGCDDADQRQAQQKELVWLQGQAKWLEETLVEMIISEAQNEVRDFKKWGVDIIPSRALMKQGFETPDGKRLDVESAFKNPEHPFRVAIVCAMWLTGFDVECLTTLYIDKPMKAHTLMQAIARANRVYPGKDFGLIVDYNGMLKSLREALAQYALGGDDSGGEEVVAPIEERVKALVSALEETENHLRGLDFEPDSLNGTKGFARIAAIADGAEAVIGSRDEGKRRFEILARQVFIRFKALIMEPSVFTFAERHDNIEAIYKKLEERRDNADVSELLKELHRIVNEAIRAAEPGDDQKSEKLFDISKINLEKLRAEFAKKAKRKASVVEDIRKIVEKKLEQMLARNPLRMDYYKKYTEIIADYNRDKDRVTIEETFARLMDLANSMSEEDRRAAEEGLSEDEYALFCLLQKDNLGKAERERVKLASKSLYDALSKLIAERDRWTEKEQTQAEVDVLIQDTVFMMLPTPPFTDEEKQALASRVFQHVWQQSSSGLFGQAA